VVLPAPVVQQVFVHGCSELIGDVGTGERYEGRLA